MNCWNGWESPMNGWSSPGSLRPPLRRKKWIKPWVYRGSRTSSSRTATGPGPWFLLLPREKRLDAKALAKSRNITRLSMVNAAALEDLLHTHAGAVGAMELMYDMEGKLELFIDRDVLDGPFVRFPPNADGRLVRIATSDFVDKLLPADQAWLYCAGSR